jgi:uncharacterized protein (TIGR00255 family)
MIRSMTGFGSARAEDPAGAVSVEIRSVNHRYLKTQFRLPPDCEAWELPLGELLRERLVRGHVTVSVAIESVEAAAPVGLDLDRARAYLEALIELRDHLGVKGEIDLPLLAGFNDLFRPRTEPALELPIEPVLAAAREALDRLMAMREEEGRALARHLAESMDRLEAECAVIAARAPERLVRERDRLRRAVRELTEDTQVDEDRLAREVAYLAERWDIEEEIVRFRSHLAQFRAALDHREGEPVGKRLGFLIQEIHREANTIGAKANDAEIAERVVTLKTVIEQVREQVENVE